LPILAEHKGGSEVVFGATGGYLVGFIVASYLVGRRAQQGASRNNLDTIAAFIVGTLTIYVLGVSWLSYATGMTIREAVAAGMAPFIVGDIIKAIAAGALLPSVWKSINPGTGAES
jgi:biotin transport system substrate-specific component